MGSDEAERFPSARLHERWCAVDTNGVATITVTLHGLRPATRGGEVVLATLVQPYCAYSFDERAAGADGQTYDVVVDDREPRTVRFTLSNLAEDVETLVWSFRVSCAVPFLGVDGTRPPHAYWQRGAAKDLIRSYVLRIRSEQLRFTLEFTQDKDHDGAPTGYGGPVFFDASPLIERMESYDDGRRHRWKPDRRVQPKLSIGSPGRSASMVIDAPPVGSRYGIEFKSRLGALPPNSDLPLNLAHAARRLCRRERPGADPLSTEFKNLLLGSLAEVFKRSELGSSTATGFLWNRTKHILEAAYGIFPYRHYSVDFRFGCGVAGHAFRFGRPAVYHNDDRRPGGVGPTESLIFENRGNYPQDWVICLPLKSGPDGAAVGVVSLSGSSDGQTSLDRELCTIARYPMWPQSTERLRNLYWLVNTAFWGTLKAQDLSQSERDEVDRICKLFGSQPNLRSDNHKHSESSIEEPATTVPRPATPPTGPVITPLAVVPTPAPAANPIDAVPIALEGNIVNSLAPASQTVPPMRSNSMLTLVVVGLLFGTGGVAFFNGASEALREAIRTYGARSGSDSDTKMHLDEALRLLKGGVEGVTEFNRRRHQGETVPPLGSEDLCNLVLSNVDLSDVDLRKTRLRTSVLYRASFNSALLMNTDLSGADLSSADLSDAKLRSAILRGADLRGVRGLRQLQLDEACGDSKTLLDPPLTIGDCPN